VTEDDQLGYGDRRSVTNGVRAAVRQGRYAFRENNNIGVTVAGVPTDFQPRKARTATPSRLSRIHVSRRAGRQGRIPVCTSANTTLPREPSAIVGPGSRDDEAHRQGGINIRRLGWPCAARLLRSVARYELSKAGSRRPFFVSENVGREGGQGRGVDAFFPERHRLCDRKSRKRCGRAVLSDKPDPVWRRKIILRPRTSDSRCIIVRRWGTTNSGGFALGMILCGVALHVPAKTVLKSRPS